jgi:hypothetical protein
MEREDRSLKDFEVILRLLAIGAARRMFLDGSARPG